MAYAITTRAPMGVHLLDRLSAGIAALRLALTRRAVYRRTLAELSGLSDRELADLGLHRASLTEIAAEAAYGA